MNVMMIYDGDDYIVFFLSGQRCCHPLRQKFSGSHLLVLVKLQELVDR